MWEQTINVGNGTSILHDAVEVVESHRVVLEKQVGRRVTNDNKEMRKNKGISNNNNSVNSNIKR